MNFLIFYRMSEIIDTIPITISTTAKSSSTVNLYVILMGSVVFYEFKIYQLYSFKHINSFIKFTKAVSNITHKVLVYEYIDRQKIKKFKIVTI